MEVLKRVDNLDLNVVRAQKSGKGGISSGRDLEQAKDEFSRVKFTYLELLTKNEFIQSVIEASGAIPDSTESEENLAQAKATLKKAKGRCQALKSELEAMLVEICRKQELLTSDASIFASELSSEDTETIIVPSCSVEEFEAMISAKQEKLQEQELSIRELNRKKTELEHVIKGLEANIGLLVPPDHQSIQIRRMANWYEKANSVIGGLCGVERVDVNESAVRPSVRKGKDFAMCLVRHITSIFWRSMTGRRLLPGRSIPWDWDGILGSSE